MQRPLLRLLVLLVVTNVVRGKDEPLCWEMKDGYNAVARMVRAPKMEKRPEVFYFGEAQNAELCRGACEQLAECAAFTWMGPATGGWMGGNNKWANQCYGRGSQAMTMVPEKGRASGRKVPCSQLEELEKSFGVDPARLTRSKEASMAAAQKGAEGPTGHPGMHAAEPSQTTGENSRMRAPSRAGKEPLPTYGIADLLRQEREQEAAATKPSKAGGRAGKEPLPTYGIADLLRQEREQEAAATKPSKAAGGTAGDDDLMAMLRGGARKPAGAAGAAAGGAGGAGGVDLASMLRGQQQKAAGGAAGDEGDDLMAMLRGGAKKPASTADSGSTSGNGQGGAAGLAAQQRAQQQRAQQQQQQQQQQQRQQQQQQQQQQQAQANLAQQQAQAQAKAQAMAQAQAEARRKAEAAVPGAARSTSQAHGSLEAAAQESPTDVAASLRRSRMGSSKRVTLPGGGGGMRRMGEATADAQPTHAESAAAATPAAAASPSSPVLQRVPVTAVPSPTVPAVPPEQLIDSGLDEMD